MTIYIDKRVEGGVGRGRGGGVKFNRASMRGYYGWEEGGPLREAMSVGERVLEETCRILLWEILISGETRGARWLNLI